MKCEKSEQICIEWAKDFLQKNDLETAGFWHSLSLAFRRDGMEVMGEGLQGAISFVSNAIDVHDIAISMVTDKKVRKSMNRIHRERIFMLDKLKQLQAEQQ